MLEFWFSPDISRFKKFLILLATALIAMGLYYYQPMPFILVLMFAATGLIFLICRYLKRIYAAKNPTGLLYRVLTWIPIALIFALLFVKAHQNLLGWGIQGLAIMALTVFVFSPQFLVQVKPKKDHENA